MYGQIKIYFPKQNCLMQLQPDYKILIYPFGENVYLMTVQMLLM